MITWKDSLSVGVDKVDEQHQELIDKMNDFMDACVNRSGKDKIEETLKFLKMYTISHFHDEEELMLQYRYPDYASHKQLHEDFIRKIIEIEENFHRSGSSTLTAIKLNRTLVDWLLNHISKMDQKLGAYILEQEETA